MRTLPDNIVVETRKTVFLKDCDNFDDICFTFSLCPSCRNQKIGLTLLPIANKELLPLSVLQETQQLILERILDADIDFLHEKSYCDCSNHDILELKTVVYCYNDDKTDFQNYIDYPFDEVKTYEISLIGSDKKQNFLFIDTETTGLPKVRKASYKDTTNWPRLVQVAWILSDENFNIISKNSFIIKPTFIIPFEASLVHKITTDKALNLGSPIESVLQLLQNEINDCSNIVAHNLQFDLNVIACELYRAGINSDILDKKHICTMEETTNYCAITGKYGFNWPKLSELHRKLFNYDFEEAHNASVDIDATFKCFKELATKNIIKI